MFLQYCWEDEDIYELLCVLEKTIYTQRKAFLEELTRSYRFKNAPKNKIYFGMTNVDAAREAFHRQVKKQIPVYIQLIDLMTTKTQAEKEEEKAQEEILAAVV